MPANILTNIDVLIPSYMCHAWIDRCLESVSKQEYRPRFVLVIDDASPDFQYSEYVAKLCIFYNFMFLRNTVNQKCPYNLRLGINILDTAQNDVIFLLDGDDFLPHEKVFSRLAEIYRDQKIYMTYGNYLPYPKNTGQQLASAYPKAVIEQRSYRAYRTAHFNHPLTFRKHLWDQVTDKDLQNKAGQWFRGGYDLVIMIPMLEMCSPDHFKFLNENLYSYNSINPMSEVPAGNAISVEESREIYSRPKREIYRREK